MIKTWILVILYAVGGMSTTPGFKYEADCIASAIAAMDTEKNRQRYPLSVVAYCIPGPEIKE